VISSQGEFCFAADVFPCDDVIIDPDDEEVIPGTPLYFTARGNDNCEPTCYQWKITSACGSTLSSEGAYQAGSMEGIDEIMLFDACTDELLATAEVRVVVEDLDEDGITDDQDNCPDTANPDQEDADRDGFGDVCDDCLDVDQDDVCDDEDRCPDSYLSGRVLVRGCDSEVANADVADGCSMNDLIGECVGEEENHGSFVSCVTHCTNAWKKAGLITGKEKGAIQSCAARLDIP
jgi:hypothetical protein